MRLVGPLLVAIVAAGLAWIATMSLLGAADAYLLRSAGMRGGDVNGPWVAWIGGGLLLVGLAALALGGVFTGMARRLLAYGGVGLAMIAEWSFADYLDARRRFSLGAGPTPLEYDASYSLQSAVVVGLHIAALVLLAAVAFVLVASTRSYFLSARG